MSKQAAPSVVSLFAGAGGMDIGLERAGFDVIWANDIDRDACNTYKGWSRATVINSDMTKLNAAEIPRANLVVGGFPCQGFSLAGPRKIDDRRNSLYRYFVRVVEETEPDAFMAENVKGILTLGGGAILEAIIADFKSKGYEVKYHLFNAADYMVPQERQRVIFVGVRRGSGLSYDFPQPCKTRIVLGDALSSVPQPKPADICSAPFSSRYMSRNRRRGWDEMSFTIPAMSKQVALHPSSPPMVKLGVDNWVFGEGSSRRFSWQEAAVIQTFPAGMEFAGDLTSIYRQIGNAVPVELAYRVALPLRQAFAKAAVRIEYEAKAGDN